MRKYTAILLDVDGTLIDSNDSHAKSWCDALAEFDRPIEFERVRKLIGKGGDKLLAETAGLDSAEGVGKSIAKRREQIFKSVYLPHLQPFPRSADLVRRMHDEGFKLAVATSAKQTEMDALLDIVGIKKWIDVTTCPDDADESKPDPDILNAALAKLDVSADRAVMVGDTPYDIEAAFRACVDAIALTSGGWIAEDLKGAMAIYRDCEQFLESFNDSPLKAPR